MVKQEAAEMLKKKGRGDKRAAAAALYPLNYGKGWWIRVWSVQSVIVTVVLVVLFVLGTLEYIIYRDKFGDAAESMEIYINIFRTAFVVVSFFIFADGVRADNETDRVNAEESTIIAVDEGSLSEYPESLRFYKSIFLSNGILQRAVLKDQEENKVLFTEVVFSSLLFHSIDVALHLNPYQDNGVVNTWRSWFRSPILQEAWPNHRFSYDELTVSYIEQELLPCSPRFVPPRWTCIAADWIRYITYFLIAMTLGGTVIWWVALWNFYESRRVLADLYVKALEALYVSALVLLLALDTQRKSRQTRYRLKDVQVRDIEFTILDNYPHSVRLYKQLYSCDTMLQRIRIPENVDPTKEIVFNVAITRILFETIDLSLSLQYPPAQDSLNLWRSWFGSPIVVESWSFNRCFFATTTVLFIDTYILPFPLVCVSTEEKVDTIHSDKRIQL